MEMIENLALGLQTALSASFGRPMRRRSHGPGRTF